MPPMIFFAKVGHRADLLPRRARKPIRTYAETEIGFDVATAAPEDAPVALVVGEKVEVRCFEGLLWRRTILSSEITKIEDKVSATARGFVAASHLDSSVSASHGGRLHGEKAAKAIARRECEVVADHSEAVAREVRKWASRDILVVGDELYRRAFSPAIWSRNIAEYFHGVIEDAPLRLSGNEGISVWFAEAAQVEKIRSRVVGFPADKVPSAGRALFRRLKEELDFRMVDRDVLHAASGDLVSNTDLTDARARIVSAWFHKSTPLAPIAGDEERMLGRAIEKAHVPLQAAALLSAVREPRSLAAAVVAMVDVVAPVVAEVPVGVVQEIGVRETRSVPYLRASAGRGSGTWEVAHKNDDIARLDEDVMVVGRNEAVPVVKSIEGTSWRLANGSWLLSPATSCLQGPQEQEAAHVQVKRFVALVAMGAELVSHDCEPGTVASAEAFGKAVFHPSQAKEPKTFGERAEAVATFMREGVVELDGTLMFRCPEPTICVRTTGFGFPDVSVVQSWTIMRSPGSRAPFMFRMDKMDDARDFAVATGHFRSPPTPPVEIIDPTGLSFDSDAWNLRACLQRIVGDMDNRLALMEPEAAIAFQKIALYLEKWAWDTDLVRGEDNDRNFVASVGILLDQLADPMYEGIGEEVYRIAAGEMQLRLNDRLGIAASQASDEDDAVIASMAM
jgi:hypothetical protein